MIDRDLPLKKEIADNIRRLSKEHRWTQKQLAEHSGIPKSTISDYLNHRTLINPGNVEKIAEAFNVSKSDIDPTFGQNKKRQQKVETIAAHIDDNVTEEQMEDILTYIDFIKAKHSK